MDEWLSAGGLWSQKSRSPKLQFVKTAGSPEGVLWEVLRMHQGPCEPEPQLLC